MDDLTWKARLAAATLTLPGAIVSHQSAASLHGLSPMGKDLVVVTVRMNTTHSFPGAIVHQSTDLRNDAIETVSGLPVTSVARTVVDLASVLGTHSLGRFVDECLLTRQTTIEKLVETLAKLSRRGKPGVEKLREVLAAHGMGAVPESELERALLALIDAAGLPAPTLQFMVPWHRGRSGRVDCAYPEAKLIIEADGRRWHSRDTDFEEDRRRDNLAALAGWRVLRFTWQQVHSGSGEVIRMVAEALGQATVRQQAS